MNTSDYKASDPYGHHTILTTSYESSTSRVQLWRDLQQSVYYYSELVQSYY
jgi:hypothetical protein